MPIAAYGDRHSGDYSMLTPHLDDKFMSVKNNAIGFGKKLTNELIKTGFMDGSDASSKDFQMVYSLAMSKYIWGDLVPDIL